MGKRKGSQQGLRCKIKTEEERLERSDGKMEKKKEKENTKKAIAVTGTKGYFLKIMAMSGAMDLNSIRIFYQSYDGRRMKDKHMKALRDGGYIQKSTFNRRRYYHLTQKGKDMVLAGGNKNVLDCSEYICGNVVTNRMPLLWKDEKDKMQRCIYQGRILSKMYQGRIPVFHTDKEDLFQNEDKIKNILRQEMEGAEGKDNKLEDMAEYLSSVKREILGLSDDKMERYKYGQRYGIYLYGREKESVSIYYPVTEIKNQKNPALNQSRAIGSLIVKDNAPYVIYYIDDKLIRWKPKAEADMRRRVGRACEKMFEGRYQGDTEYVRGMFIVKDYDVVLRMIEEEEQSIVRRNLTLSNRVYKQNHYVAIEDMEYYYEPELSLKIIREIIKRYEVKSNHNRFVYNGMRAWFGFRVSSNDIEQMNGGYVFCLRSQAKLYEELGMFPIEIDEISEEIKNLSKK